MRPQVLRVSRVVRRNCFFRSLLQCLDVLHLVLVTLRHCILIRHVECRDQTGVYRFTHELNFVFLDIGTGPGRLRLLLEKGVLGTAHVDIQCLSFLLLG